MADSNQDYIEQLPDLDADTGEATPTVEPPRRRDPRLLPRQVAQLTPPGMIRMTAYRNVPHYLNPNRRQQRHVPFMNARTRSALQPLMSWRSSSLYMTQSEGPFTVMPPRRLRNGNVWNLEHDVNAAHCIYNVANRSAAYNPNTPPRFRTRAANSRNARSRGRVYYSPETGCLTCESNVPGESGASSSNVDQPAVPTRGSYEVVYSPNTRAGSVAPRRRTQFRGPVSGAHQTSRRNGSPSTENHSQNPVQFCQSRSDVHIIPVHENDEIPPGTEEALPQGPLVYNDAISVPQQPEGDTSTFYHVPADHSQHEPMSPSYANENVLCPWHANGPSYISFNPGYRFNELSNRTPAMPMPTTYTYVNPNEQPTYMPYYSSATSSGAHANHSIAYPYTHPSNPNFVHQQRAVPFYPYQETTYYPQNHALPHYYPQPTPDVHYSVSDPSTSAPHEPNEEIVPMIIPIRIDPSTETPSSPPAIPSPRNIDQLPSTSEKVSPTTTTPGQAIFSHVFVPSTSHSSSNVIPPFTSFGITSESRQQRPESLYHLCDTTTGPPEGQGHTVGAAEFFLYDCTTCPPSNPPCQQWVVVAPKLSIISCNECAGVAGSPAPSSASTNTESVAESIGTPPISE